MPSAYIFGSTARGRVDALSDRDVLIVAKSNDEIVWVAEEWMLAGWSISKFTHSHFIEMANNGSLFVQHVKQEGKIVYDDDGFVRSVLSSFVPRLDYCSEGRESFALLQRIKETEAGYWSLMCAADIAYGAIRNLAILQLAAEEVYVFDYSDLIDRFASKAGLSGAMRNALLGLRSLKHGYRKRCAALGPDLILKNALAGADELFGKRRNDPGCLTSGYGGLRCLELYLVGRADPRELDLMPGDDPLGDTWALIRDPRGYRPPPASAGTVWLDEQYSLARERFPGVVGRATL